MDAESGRIQGFLRRKLGLHDPESADSGASETPLTPEGSGRARKAQEYRLYWLERKRALADARANDHPQRSPMRSLVAMAAGDVCHSHAFGPRPHACRR